jgi:sugar phosphate isomerase/epimerase
VQHRRRIEPCGATGWHPRGEDAHGNQHRSRAGERHRVARASQSPNYWFKRAPGRFLMWHVKDMHKTSRDYTELGNGTIDFTKIWPDAELAGLKHFFVEQGGNFTHDPFRSITDSAEYVKRVLLR